VLAEGRSAEVEARREGRVSHGSKAGISRRWIASAQQICAKLILITGYTLSNYSLIPPYPSSSRTLSQYRLAGRVLTLHPPNMADPCTRRHAYNTLSSLNPSEQLSRSAIFEGILQLYSTSSLHFIPTTAYPIFCSSGFSTPALRSLYGHPTHRFSSKQENPGI